MPMTILRGKDGRFLCWSAATIAALCYAVPSSVSASSGISLIGQQADGTVLVDGTNSGLRSEFFDGIASITISESGDIASLLGISGSGLIGIHGSGLRGIHGSGLRGIHGSGLRGIHGSGLRGIHGSGLRGIHGSGLRGIHGSGLRGIHGSGLRGIHGSGLRAEDWGPDAATVSDSLIAVGPIESIDKDFSSIVIAGQEIFIIETSMMGQVSWDGTEKTLTGARSILPNLAEGNVVAVSGALLSPGQAVADILFEVKGSYIAGSSPVYVRVLGSEPLDGSQRITSGGVAIDFAATDLIVETLSPGVAVEVVGYLAGSALIATSAAAIHHSTGVSGTSTTDYKLTGVHGSGLRGIHGSGLRGIHGSGLRGIHGSGLRSIQTADEWN